MSQPSDDDLSRDLVALFNAEAEATIDVRTLVQGGLQRGVQKRRVRRLTIAVAAAVAAFAVPVAMTSLRPTAPTVSVRPPSATSGPMIDTRAPSITSSPNPTGAQAPKTPTDTGPVKPTGAITSHRDGDKVATCQFYRGTTNVGDPEALVLITVNLDRPGRFTAEFLESAAPKWIGQQRMQVSGDRFQVTLWALAPGGKSRIDRAAAKPHDNYTQLVYDEAIKGKRLDRIVVTSKGGGINACKGGPPGAYN